MEFSIEAKVVVGAFWGILPTDELSFQRPHIIHPRTRKGLDELVEAGLLTVEKFNKHSATLVWKPTDKMKTDKPQVPQEFMKEHSFPITTE